MLSTDSTGLSVRIFLWLPWNVSSDILSPKEKKIIYLYISEKKFKVWNDSVLAFFVTSGTGSATDVTIEN